MPDLRVDPAISPAQLHEFYRRNNICEAGYPEGRTAELLRHPSVIVAAFEGETLIGIARALADGLSAVIMELSVDLRWQGTTLHENGSLIENDASGLAMRLARALLDELAAREIDFISYDIHEASEAPFFRALGFKPNVGQVVHYIDKRPYIEPA